MIDIIDVNIATEEIQLDQFLKFVGAISSGGALKPLLAEGMVILNGKTETARRRKLHSGDVVELQNIGAWRVVQG